MLGTLKAVSYFVKRVQSRGLHSLIDSYILESFFVCWLVRYLDFFHLNIEGAFLDNWYYQR